MKSRHMYRNPKLNFVLVSGEKTGIFFSLFSHEKKRSKISNAANRRHFSPTSRNNNNNNILRYFYISAWHCLSNYTSKVDGNLLTGYSIFLDILQKLRIRVAVLFFIIAPFNRTLFHFAGHWRAHCGCGCRARVFFATFLRTVCRRMHNLLSIVVISFVFNADQFKGDVLGIVIVTDWWTRKPLRDCCKILSSLLQDSIWWRSGLISISESEETVAWGFLFGKSELSARVASLSPANVTSRKHSAKCFDD